MTEECSRKCRLLEVWEPLNLPPATLKSRGWQASSWGALARAGWCSNMGIFSGGELLLLADLVLLLLFKFATRALALFCCSHFRMDADRLSSAMVGPNQLPPPPPPLDPISSTMVNVWLTLATKCCRKWTRQGWMNRTMNEVIKHLGTKRKLGAVRLDSYIKVKQIHWCRYLLKG